MISKRLMFGTFAIVAVLGLAPPAAAQGPQFVVDSVQTNGNGCPAGTTDAQTLGNTLIVTFSAMTASTPPFGTMPVANCTITARIRLQGGIRVNLAQVNYTGAASIGKGSAMLSRRAFFAGTQGNRTTSYITRDGQFTFSDFQLFPTIASCGKPSEQALVGANISIIATGSESFVDLASVDASLRLVFTIIRC